MRPWFKTLLVGAAVLGAAPAAAQTVPLSFEVRLDAGLPVQDADDLLDSGVGFGVRAMLDVAPTFALYGGYSRFEFEVDDELVTATWRRRDSSWEAAWCWGTAMAPRSRTFCSARSCMTTQGWRPGSAPTIP
jgi:hypothetical protein